MAGRKRATKATDSKTATDEEVAAKVARVDETERESTEDDEQEAANNAVKRELGLKMERIAVLEEQLSKKEVNIVQLKDEIDSSTASFKTIVALKNQKIKELEKIIAVAKAAPPLNSNNSQNEWLKIRAVFAGISKINGKPVFSSKTISSHYQWAIRVSKTATHLKLFLHGKPLGGSDRISRRAGVKLLLLAHEDCSALREMNMNGLVEFDMTTTCWGIARFITLEDLMNPDKKFVRDDSIIAEIWIKEFDFVASNA